VWVLSLPHDWRILSSEEDVQDEVQTLLNSLSTQIWVTNHQQNLIPPCRVPLTHSRATSEYGLTSD